MIWNIVSNFKQRVLADYNGKLYTKVFSNFIFNQARNEDFEFENLPLVEYKYEFKYLLVDANTTETVKKIVGTAKYSEDIEAIVFFYLYPKGRHCVKFGH